MFLMTALCFALFACAFNLLLGYVGLMSFGHAMFFGIAGYFFGHVVKAWDMPPEVGILAGVAGAAAAGPVTGALAIRRQGIYFAMITLAFAQMIYFFCIQAPFTGGEDGLQGIARKPLLGGLIPTKDDRVLYYVVLAIFLFGYGTIYRIIHSPFGQVLKAIRDNEQRAVSLGYEADRYKLLAFVLSAALAGLAGATKAMVLQFATLTDVSAAMSGEVVLMALVGGLGTIIGPVVGAFIIITMQNYLAATGEFVLVIQGVIFVVIVMAFRKGLVGELTDWWKSRRRTRRARPGRFQASSSVYLGRWPLAESETMASARRRLIWRAGRCSARRGARRVGGRCSRCRRRFACVARGRARRADGRGVRLGPPCRRHRPSHRRALRHPGADRRRHGDRGGADPVDHAGGRGPARAWRARRCSR